MIKRRYDRHYHENIFYREAPDSQRNRKRIEALRQVKESGSLLEIGCGTGGFLRQAEAYFDVEGVDVSKYAIQTIRERFGDRVQVGNVEQHPLPKERYDVIVVFNILEHLRQPAKVVARISTALKPGGVMIGSVPYNAGLVGGLITRVGNLIDRTHVSTLPPDAWQRMFEHAGFHKIDFFGEMNFGRNWCTYIRGRSWDAVAFNLMFVCGK